MAGERIASGEIFVDLDDEAALAGLRKVEADFASTMQRIEREKATVELRATEEKLKRDLDKAKAETRKFQKYVNDAETELLRKRRRRKLEEAEQDEKAARGALKAHRIVMRAKGEQAREEARSEARQVAIQRRQQQRQRILEQAERRRLQELRRIDAFQGRMSKQREREMATAHRDALRMNQDLDNQALAVRRLQRQYHEAHMTLEKLNRENSRFKGRLLRTPGAQQTIDLNIAEAEAKMVRLQAELRAMGARPIKQEVQLDIDREGIGTLNRWISAITETTVRVGPFTTTIAGLSRALLLLGPIMSGLVGQASALVGVLGAGAVGAIGATAGAIGAFGLSLGGVGLLMPKLLNDFKNLNSLQDAYHKQVLKTGRNSDSAKEKLKQFEHALGEVPPTTRRTFLSLDKLNKRWDNLSKQARPTFFTMLAQGIDTVTHHMDFFEENTLTAFDRVSEGWNDWMEGLRSGEADRILSNLGRNGNRSIRPLMGALGNLATFFGRVAESFSAHLPSLMRGFRAWTQGLADTAGDTDRLDRSTSGLVDSMRAVGRLTASIGRVITAFFAPGVDDGTQMVERWADGLDRLAKRMRGGGRQSIDEWFKSSIALAEQFWRSLKPLAEIFFEWTTIMRPFTVIALDVLAVLGDIVQALADFKPTRAILVGAFGLFLYGALVKRVGSVATGMWSIARAIGAIKAAGGIGAAIKGGLIRFASGGLAGRGSTPANPLFVMNVGPGGGPGVVPGGKGGPVGGAGGMGTMLRNLPRVVKFGGPIVALAGGMWELNRAMDALGEKRGLEIQDKKLKELVGQRNLGELHNMRNELTEWAKDGKGNSDKFIRGIDQAIDAVHRLNQQDLDFMSRSIQKDWNRVDRESKVTLKRVSGLADYHFKLIENSAIHGTTQARMAASRNFNRARDAIKSAMKAGTIDTKKGLALIEDLWVRALDQYGFTPKEARNIRKTGDPQGNKGREGGAQRIMKARGGLMQVGRKGQRGPDSVPMNLGGVPSVVAPGEQIAVFNDHQQRKFARTYPGGLEGFFSGPQRPHGFQGGGIVPVPGFPGERAAASVIPMIERIAHAFHVMLTDAFGPGHKSPGHTIYGTAADFSGPDANMDRAVQSLVRAGYKVLYDGRFGSTAWPGHGPSYVAGGNAHFHVELGGKGDLAALAPQIARVIMQTDLGNMSVAGQGALDLAHSAAQANLDAVFQSAMMTGEATTGGAGAATRAQMVAWARTALSATAGLGHGGPTPGNISKILELAMKESNWIVRSLNTWDVNAKNGNPSGGLMHVTLDKVGGSYARLYNPIQNMIASIRYQMARYGQLITFSPYAMGGLVPMAQKMWERGGKIEQPTLMTGEDKGKHPEFVIGTNPMFRNSNLDALHAAASALGIGQARKSKKPTKPKYVRHAGKEVGKLDPIVDYRRLQGKEEDKTREISIAQSRVQEPSSFLKEAGKNADGDTLYVIDQDKVTTYEKQIQAVVKLYEELVGKKGKGGIMERLAAAADRSYKRITNYIEARQANIEAIDKAMKRDRKLSRSKDDDTARAAQKRLDRAGRLRDSEVQKIRDARDARGDIREDQHDAKYRVQEYDIDRRSAVSDRDAVRGRATEDLTSSNPAPLTPEEAPTDAGGPSIFEQVRILSEARSDLLRSFGSNFALGAAAGAASAFIPTLQRPQQPGVGALGTNPSARAVQSSSFATGSVRRASVPTSTSAAGVAGGAGGGGVPVFSADGTAHIAGAGGGNIIDIRNYFPTPPPDPHTWSRGVAYELQAAL